MTTSKDTVTHILDNLAPPYDGAKDHYAVPAERLDDRDWLQAFISRTAAELPPPKSKRPKKSL